MEQYVIKNQKKLRCGITSGTCATAAATAACLALLLKDERNCIKIKTPKGVEVEVPVLQDKISPSKAAYYVVKDSGDDPDVTNNCRIYASVEFVGKDNPKPENAFSSDKYEYLFLDGGVGVGRVTKSGLEQAVGMAAINQVPREMIFSAIGNVCEHAGCEERLLVTIYIPDGEELAKKTFNGKLGIEGGLSILGTSGILEPMSEQAIVSTIETEIRQLANNGKKKLLVTPGNYGQAYASEYLKLNLADSVKSSNYIGETIDFAISYGYDEVLIVGNIGKLVKLAAGIFNTHSKVADGRHEIFVTHTALCGGNKEILNRIMECINTEAMLDVLEAYDLKDVVIKSICDSIEKHISDRVRGSLKIGVFLFSEGYGFLGKTAYGDEILDSYRKL